jgi:hypothetical protein
MTVIIINAFIGLLNRLEIDPIMVMRFKSRAVRLEIMAILE